MMRIQTAGYSLQGMTPFVASVCSIKIYLEDGSSRFFLY